MQVKGFEDSWSCAGFDGSANFEAPVIGFDDRVEGSTVGSLRAR